MDNPMSSRILSRLLPVADGDISVYEGLRREAARQADLEAHPRRGYSQPFHDDDEDDVPHEFLYDAAQETPTDPGQSPEILASPQVARGQTLGRGKSRLEEDEDVPESLLLEPKRHRGPAQHPSRMTAESRIARTEAQWRATQEQQGLHSSQAARSARPSSRPSQTAAVPTHHLATDPRIKAAWLYTNATNLDTFLLEIYQYYVEHGIWSILLSRTISLLTELFVFAFATFLTTCIDYSKIPSSSKTSEILIPKCMAKASWLKSTAMFFFLVYWMYQLQRHVRSYKRLRAVHDFFHYCLGISDNDIQTVSWVRVVDGLVKMQNANIATANPSQRVKKYLDYRSPPQRLTAESIANRLMRKANYYVALYNKDILDFDLQLPFIGNRQFYSKTMEWCIDFCFTNFIFDERGSIREFCLQVKNRGALVAALRRRLQFVALISILFAPFNIVRFCIMYFFRYYTEFTRNPSRASARAFTPFAEWKIREFNELDHLFNRRIRQALPFANDYLKQFPKDKMDQICRFIAFVSGSFAAVLALATAFDSELFLGFEITPGRTTIFWLGLLSVIFGIAHGSLPDEADIHDPMLHLKEVLLYTHYMPAHWKDRLHSNEVRSEFSAMYQMKVLIFAEEILSLIMAPIILFKNSNRQCERIIDFFREQTVHVDGVGHQCNFAVFGFKKDPNAEDPTTLLHEQDGLRDDYYGVKDDKMAQSVQNFMQYYSHYNHRQGARRRPQAWQPPPAWPPVISAHTAAPVLANDPRQKPSPTAVRKSGMIVSPPPPPRTTTTTASLLRSPRQMGRKQPQQPLHAVSESRLMSQDSDLQDYADAPGEGYADAPGEGYADGEELESDTDGDGGVEGRDGRGAPAQVAGVLGMLAQLSRAQTEKKAGGVGVAAGL